MYGPYERSVRTTGVVEREQESSGIFYVERVLSGEVESPFQVKST